jgi:type II secretory pathway component PulJ
MPSKREQQQGIVLVVALIMMAVIAVSSAAAIRSVITQDQIGQNLRRQSSARQSAEGMLRLCEAALASLAPSALRASTTDSSALARPIQPCRALAKSWQLGRRRPACLRFACGPEHRHTKRWQAPTMPDGGHPHDQWQRLRHFRPHHSGRGHRYRSGLQPRLR